MNVSVIIIFYNEENYIGKCIQSLLDQTYQDFELILVNDGSTDESEKIVREYDDSRIKYVRLVENNGFATARNEGLKTAIGKYIFFTDADCIASSDWVQKGIDFMEDNPRLVAAYGRVINHRVSNNPNFIWDRGVYRRGLVSKLYPHPSTVN